MTTPLQTPPRCPKTSAFQTSRFERPQARLASHVQHAARKANGRRQGGRVAARIEARRCWRQEAEGQEAQGLCADRTDDAGDAYAEACGSE